MWRRIALVPVALAALAGGWMLIPNRFFYANRRPTRLGRIANRAMSWWASMGLPPAFLQVTLETRGRASGMPRSQVLVVAEHAGERYLVSMLGERSDWVRNVRAAGGEAVIRSRRRRPVRLEEVPVDLRAPVLRAYLRRAFGARPHFPIGPDAPLEAFERIAADYPAFRIESRNNHSPI